MPLAFVLAQSTAPGGGMDSILIQILPFVAIFAIMYFLILRPQSQRMRAHKEMISNVRRGDVVVTSGGIIGKIIRVVDDHEVQVEIAENVRVRLLRSMIAEVRSKGEAAKEGSTS